MNQMYTKSSREGRFYDIAIPSEYMIAKMINKREFGRKARSQADQGDGEYVQI